MSDLTFRLLFFFYFVVMLHLLLIIWLFNSSIPFVSVQHLSLRAREMVKCLELQYADHHVVKVTVDWLWTSSVDYDYQPHTSKHAGFCLSKVYSGYDDWI